MSFHSTGNPQAVYVNVIVSLNRNPCIFSRNIFNKTLAALLAPVKNKPVFKAVFHPFLFSKALFSRHGAADVLQVNVFFCNFYIFHKAPSRKKINISVELHFQQNNAGLSRKAQPDISEQNIFPELPASASFHSAATVGLFALRRLRGSFLHFVSELLRRCYYP